VRPPALTPPRLPHAGVHVWSWFLDLHNGRGGGGFGPAPLSWHDFEAWARLRGLAPEGWEVDALLRLDQAWLTEMSK
jgi:hypothetical protein